MRKLYINMVGGNPEESDHEVCEEVLGELRFNELLQDLHSRSLVTWEQSNPNYIWTTTVKVDNIADWSVREKNNG